MPLFAALLGAGIWAFLLYGWLTPGSEWVVFTIFPMMGTPYIIATFFVYQGVKEMLIVARERLTDGGS